MKRFIVQLTIGLSMTAFLLVALAAYRGARRDAQKHTCIYALGVLEDVKRRWAEENSKMNGDEVRDSDLRKYFKGGIMPSCEAGGTFTIRPVGTPPKCRIELKRITLWAK